MAFNPDKCLKFICDVAPVTISIGTSKVDSSHYKFSKDGLAWVVDTITLQPGESAYCRGTNYPSNGENSVTRFSMIGDGVIDLDGSIVSLIDDGEGSLLDLYQPFCFNQLFANLAQLRKIINPLLCSPTTLSEGCYYNLFSECSNLDICEDFTLPARQLPHVCYEYMFMASGVTKIPASFFGTVEYLNTWVYGGIFASCAKLKVIEFPFYSWTGSNNTTNWVYGIASGGTFYCKGMIYETQYFGNDNIPTGWTVKKLYEFDPEKCLKITCLKGSFDITLSDSVYQPYKKPYYFSRDGVEWVKSTIHLDQGQSAYVKGTIYPSYSESVVRNFVISNQSIDAQMAVSGHLTSLVDDGAGEYNAYKYQPYAFDALFANCEILTTISSDLLYSLIPSEGEFENMFYNCVSLESIPEDLLKTDFVLKNRLYRSMFQECKSLTEIPRGLLSHVKKLENTGLMQGMFMGCTNLHEIYVHFSAWNDSINATYNWVVNVPSTGTFHCPPQLPQTHGYSYIPTGWNAKDDWNPEKCLKFTCSGAEVTISIGASKVDSSQYYFSKDGTTWVANTITLQPGEYAYCRGSNYPVRDSLTVSSFTMTGSGRIAVSGNLLSMVDNGVGDLSKIEREYAFFQLFYNCSQISKIEEEFFVATPGDMADNCYQSLFEGCSNLQQIRVPFTTWHKNATRNWVTNVAADGDFYALEELPKTFDVSHIPPSWKTKALYTILDPFAIYANLRGKTVSPKDPVLFNGKYVPINRNTGEAGPAPTPTSPSTLISGHEIKAKREQLVDAASINKIKFAKTSIFPDNAVTVSTTDSQTPVKMWFDQNGGILYFGSISDHIYANEDMDRLFMNLPNCSFADISWVDMSTAKNIEAFVYGYGNNLAESYIQGFGHMDLSSVTKISIFIWDSSLKIPKNSVFNFESMEDGSGTTLFSKMPNLTDDIFKTLKFKFPKLHTLYGYSDVQGVFINIPITEFPAGVFEFGTNLTGGLKHVFCSLPNVKRIDVSDWPVKLPVPATGQSVNCWRVFYQNPNLEEIDISGWDIYNANAVGGFLYDCAKLERVYVDETWHDNDHPSSYFVTGGADMIWLCPNLRGQFGHALGSPGTGIPAWMKIDKLTMNGALTCKYRDAEAELLDGRDFSIALKKACNFTNPTPETVQATVTSIEPRETAIPGSRFHQVISSNTTGPKVYACLSSDNKILQIISEAKKVYSHYSEDLRGEDLNFKNGTLDMFRGFQQAKTIDISWIDFSRSQVCGTHMFYDCESLTDVIGLEDVDFTGSGRADMEDKRYETNLQSFFLQCFAITDKVIEKMNQAKISNIVDMYYTFHKANGLRHVNIEFDLGGIKTNSNCSRMFYQNTGIIDVSFAKAKNWTYGGNLAEAFRLCSNLKYVDLSSLLYPSNLWAIFAECPALVMADLSRIRSDFLGDVTQGTVGAIFWNCYALNRFYLSDDWILPDGAQAAHDTFENCHALMSQCGHTISSGIRGNLFRVDDPYHHGGTIGLGCYKPKTLYPANGEAINLAIKAVTGSKVGTGSVTDDDQKVLHFVISDHYEIPTTTDREIARESLETYTKPDGTTGHLIIPNGTFFRWDATTRTITFFTMAEKNYAAPSLAHMFRGFSAAKDIDISWLSVDNVDSYTAMFYDCTNLEQVTYPQKTDISLAENVNLDYAFARCGKIKDIDLSFLNLTNPEVTLNLMCAFRECTSLESFKLPTIATKIKKVIFGEGFYGCTSLKKVDLTTVKCDTMTYENAFSGASALKTVGLPALKMASGAFDISGLFSGITNLASVDFSKWELSSNVKLSCKNTFSGCTNLHRIYLPQDPAKWAAIADDSLEQPFATNCERLTGDKGTRYSTALNKGKYLVLDKAPASVGFGSTLHEYY